jgi:hypothetical protein
MVVVFRMLVLQSLYNLSDEQVEYQVRAGGRPDEKCAIVRGAPNFKLFDPGQSYHWLKAEPSASFARRARHENGVMFLHHDGFHCFGAWCGKFDLRLGGCPANVRISGTAFSCLLHVKGYGTYGGTSLGGTTFTFLGFTHLGSKSNHGCTGHQVHFQDL